MVRVRFVLLNDHRRTQRILVKVVSDVKKKDIVSISFNIPRHFFWYFFNKILWTFASANFVKHS